MPGHGHIAGGDRLPQQGLQLGNHTGGPGAKMRVTTYNDYFGGWISWGHTHMGVRIYREDIGGSIIKRHLGGRTGSGRIGGKTAKNILEGGHLGDIW